MAEESPTLSPEEEFLSKWSQLKVGLLDAISRSLSLYVVHEDRDDFLREFEYFVHNIYFCINTYVTRKFNRNLELMASLEKQNESPTEDPSQNINSEEIQPQSIEVGQDDQAQPSESAGPDMNENSGQDVNATRQPPVVTSSSPGISPNSGSTIQPTSTPQRRPSNSNPSSSGGTPITRSKTKRRQSERLDAKRRRKS